jgi:hypothetical protein
VSVLASGLERRQHLVEHLLRVTEQHAVVVLEEERVVDAGVAGGGPDLERWAAN